MPDSAPENLITPDPPVAIDARDRLTAVIEILLCSSVPTQLAIGAMLRAIGLPTTEASGIFLQLVLDTFVVIGLMVAILRAHGERPSLVWKGPRRAVREAAIGLATAPLLFFGSAIFLNALRLFFPSLHNVPNNPLERLANNAQQSAIFAVVAILAGGIREELQRGFMLYRFEKYLGGGGVGLVVTSVLFGLLHGIQGWDAMIVTGCLGAFWAAMYLRRRSTIGPMSSHALFDTLQILRLAVGGDVSHHTRGIMPKAIRIYEQGGPEVMKWEDVDLAPPGPGEIRMRHDVIGLNYIDTYHRAGVYKIPLPSGVGSEAAGVVEAVGDGVTEFKAGDRVCYASGTPLQPIGSYGESRNIPAARVVKIPDGITSEQAAAMMLKGMTVQYLIKRLYKVKPGETVVFHAAAGGVGLIACQWLKALGVTTIATAGSDEKCELAKAHGAAHCINYKTDDFAARVKEITGGKGVPVVYDGVGKDTFDKSLECLAPFGTMVTFGNASGPVPPVDLGKLKGSLFLTRPSLVPYSNARQDLVAMASDLFDVVKAGKVKIDINQRYPVKDAVQAHRDLESRKTTGSTVLVP